LYKKVIDGDIRAAARLMRKADDRDSAVHAELTGLFPATGKAHVIGVTGNPGSGKSTLVDMLVKDLRARGKTVGVVAIDPSSPFTGGAILGDRIRMQRHFNDEGVFIRSLATRGHLGGLTRSTNDVVTIMDAMGYDCVIIETVGVGQDEVDVVKTAHTSVVVLVPGLGDDIQIMKAGLLEIADVFVVNKADRGGADRIVAELETVQHIVGQNAREYRPIPILKTVATSNTGITEMADAIVSHYTDLEDTGGLEMREEERLTEMIFSLVGETSRAYFRRQFDELDKGNKLTEKLVSRKASPYDVAEELLKGARMNEGQGPGAGSRDGKRQQTHHQDTKTPRTTKRVK